MTDLTALTQSDLDELLFSTILALRPQVHKLSRTRILQSIGVPLTRENEKLVSKALQRLTRAGKVYHLDYGISGWFPTPMAEAAAPMIANLKKHLKGQGAPRPRRGATASIRSISRASWQKRTSL